MRITDFQTARTLSDVCITLTHAEVEELAAYLRALILKPGGEQVFLGEPDGKATVRLDPLAP